MDLWVPEAINELNLVANALFSRGIHFRKGDRQMNNYIRVSYM